MKKFFYGFLLSLFTIFSAKAEITILACEPEWQMLAREIAKDKIEINLAIPADEDPRNPEFKPLVKRATRARMFFCNGGELEEKWLMRLANDSRNIKIVSDPENNILFAQDFVDENFPDNFGSRVHLNPYNIAKVAAEFTARIKILDPINANFYQNSYEEFSKKWAEEIIKWEKKAQPLKGKIFIASDETWNYLEDWLQINIISRDENISSSQSKAVQLNDFYKMTKDQKIEAIIFADFEDKRDLFWLSNKLKTRMTLLPLTVNLTSESNDLFKMFETTIARLLAECLNGICN